MYEIYCKLRDERGLKDADVVKATGITKSTFSDWKSGRSKPKQDKLQKIADFFEVSLDYLTTGEDIPPLISVSNIFPIELKKFPILGEIACGKPKYTNEDRESYVMAGANVKADFCLRASGDSMINARILDGDIVFIRKQDMVENGEIAAVVVNNDSEATLKRVFYYPEKGLLILKPENPIYEDFIFPLHSNL